MELISQRNHIIITLLTMAFWAGTVFPLAPSASQYILRLSYSTLLGGDFSTSKAIAVDPQGNAYILGETDSLPFPGSTRIVRASKDHEPGNTFVTKLDAQGRLVYSTVLTGNYLCSAIAVDHSGNVYIAGKNRSRVAGEDLLATPKAFQQSGHGGKQPFIIKLNPTGDGLVYATYLGGSGDDYITDIVVDLSGYAYVTGRSNSSDFPTTPGAYRAAAGTDTKPFSNYFVSKIDQDGSALIYSTCLGGTEDDDLLRGVPIWPSKLAVDSAGNVYVGSSVQYEHYYFDPAKGRSAIVSRENRIPTSAFQRSAPYDPDDGRLKKVTAFITKLNPTGSKLLYSTYLGGKADIYCIGLALDPAGNAYITGVTSGGFPVTASAFQRRFNQGGRLFDPLALLRENPFKDLFLSALNPTGSALLYSTYFGGYDDDGPTGIATDGAGGIYITGETSSHNFPRTRSAIQTKITKIKSAFAVRFNN